MKKKNKTNITYILEITKACNNNCKYCYNVWKADPNYPKQELNINQWKILIDKIIDETNPKLIAISGGEPLIKKGYEEIISHINKHQIPITFITNGTLLTEDIIKKCLKYSVTNFELPILGSNAKIHDDLTRNNGSWDKVIENIQTIKKLGGRVTAVFVLNKYNIGQVKEMLKIAIALADNILVNFFNVGGMGIKYKKELMINASELKRALTIINQLAHEYEISVGCGIPVPKCVLDVSIFDNIKFGVCQIGKKNPYYAIDPAGNLRLCNHSGIIFGNVLKEKVENLLQNEVTLKYINTNPSKCKNCKIITECQGGCRASAEVYYNDINKLNPFVEKNFQGIIK